MAQQITPRKHAQSNPPQKQNKTLPTNNNKNNNAPSQNNADDDADSPEDDMFANMEMNDDSDKQEDQHKSQFIELYNYGTSPIDLSQDTLTFTGFMTSASFGKETTSSGCTITIQPKQYLVIYDNSLPSLDHGV